MIGRKFERLTVIEKASKDKYYKKQWKCQCECDNKIIIVREEMLVSGRTKSCGCLKSELNKQKRKYNTYDLNGKYGIGYTEKGEEFYFDLEDYDKIKYHYWSIHNNYVVSRKNNETILMHRFILNPPKDKVIDHIDYCRHDNRKINLRICTDQENTRNEVLAINNTSGKTGVCYESSTSNWRAYININNKSVKLGTFNTFEDALKVRLKAEKEIFGEFRNKEQELKYGQI